jgi:SOS-response transcriptional repressor LexA
MARLIAGRPEARQALDALVDLLSKGASEKTRSDNMRQVSSTQPSMQLTDKVLVPIVGRTAAGHLAFWREDEELVGLRDLRSLAEAALAGDAESMFETEITTAGPPYAKAGSAAVVAFAESRQVGDVLVNGVVVLATEKLGRRLVAVEIDGESMEGVLHSGDYILVDTAQTPALGEIALVRVEGQIGTTCKIFLPEGDEIRLIPANAAYETTVVKKDQIRWACRVVGAVRRSARR